MKEYFTFIVLHYNCFEETRACVDSILRLDESACIRVVIMDNASVNDSLRQLQETYHAEENVYVLHNDTNTGFSAGNNLAYAYAAQHWDSEFVVFANNDLLFEDTAFVRKVRAEYEKSRFGVLGPDIFHTTQKIHQSPMDHRMILPVRDVKKTIICNTLALWFFPIFYLFFRGLVQETMTSAEALSYQTDIVPMGACLIFSRDFLERKSVVFSPETYFYYEEYILSYWCVKHDITIVFQPEIQVLHNHGCATKSMGDDRKVMRFRMKNILTAAKTYYRLICS